MKKEKSLFSASITTEKDDDVFAKRIILAPAWAAGILKMRFRIDTGTNYMLY